MTACFPLFFITVKLTRSCKSVEHIKIFRFSWLRLHTTYNQSRMICGLTLNKILKIMHNIISVKKQELHREDELEKSLILPHDWTYYDKLVSRLHDHFTISDRKNNVILFFEEIQNEFYKRQYSLHEVMYIMYCYGELLQDNSWFEQLQNLGRNLDESTLI